MLYLCSILSHVDKLITTMEIPKGFGEKTFKGCGCISIGIVLMLIIALIPGTCTDDEETADEKAGEQNTEQVEKKDSVLVNSHTVPVPV